MLERPEEALPTPRQLWRAADRHSFSNAVAAWLMAVTGPFIVLLGVAVGGGMTPADINSWVFGAFGLGGALSVTMSWLYRIPLGMGWTIPGAVLLGGSLDHLPFAECVGAFYITGALMTVLGLSGWVGRISAHIPLNIVMAMVAGVFLPFVLKIITGFSTDWRVAAATVGTFVLASGVAYIRQAVPPILLAIAVGGIIIGLTGSASFDAPLEIALAKPLAYVPQFTWRASIELVIPLMITVIGIHNLQGFAISEAHGYQPPRNVLTTVCGVMTFPFAVVGIVPTCVTGPANGILNTSGEKERRYVGGILFGAMMVLFGLFAPVATTLVLALPLGFVGLVGGLAMFEVLRGAFLTAFSGKRSVGALTTFLVTVADQPIANIGAPFWAVVFGLSISWIFDRQSE